MGAMKTIGKNISRAVTMSVGPGGRQRRPAVEGSND
jgi:hypothetical protein